MHDGPKEHAVNKGRKAPETKQVRKSRAALWLTFVFMLVLAGLGLAGYKSLDLLRAEMRVPTQNDIATQVCTAYEQQNYGLLMGLIDPTPIPPATTGTFGPAAQKALTAELQALDANSGKVVNCSASRLQFGNVSAPGKRLQYTFVMVRAKDPAQPFSQIMTFIQQADGSWKIARNSNFIGIAG